MRLFFVIAILIFSTAIKAQTLLPVNYFDYTLRNPVFLHNFSDSSNKKWSLDKYVSMSTGFSFFRGGNATVVAAPVGLQLTRKLNNNLYTFAAVSVAPAYVNFNNTFLSANTKGFQTNNFLKTNSFSMYSRAELGLMYVNDAKTFSISGSIGVERNNFPVYPYQPVNNKRQNTFIAPNR